MFAVAIEMPSGMQSREHEFKESADAEKLVASYIKQMSAWSNFEAHVLVKEDGKELYRRRIFTV